MNAQPVIQNQMQPGKIDPEKRIRSQENQPILISGPPRGGTTWVGKLVSASPAVAYIHEPFNLSHETQSRPGLCSVRLPYWYFYIDSTNEKEYIDSLRDVIQFRYRPWKKARKIHGPKDSFRWIRDATRIPYFRLRKFRPLVKDPIAIFSLDWLQDSFDMQVVLLSRNPLSFVSSIKKLNWQTNFNEILKQDRLIELHLHRFRDEIYRLSKNRHDVIDNAVLLWKLFHYRIMSYRESHKDWLFLRHEDLANDPETMFETVFKYLRLDFSDSIRSMVRQTTRADNPQEVRTSERHSIFRDSQATINNWRQRLSPSEAERVRTMTSELASEFDSAFSGPSAERLTASC